MAYQKYPNLEAEMARHGVTQGDLAEDCCKRSETISSWMTGRNGDFPIVDAIRIAQKRFPGCDVEYLFEVNPQPAA